ncbi:hypothetical protein AQ505_01175 [Pedobacter sp. PACM 27299]|uniref:GIN domain-containing protein n=1 Tax=Pedobacter sp. PACM 27299 TaxID=1727164 RepID=UPI00070608F3|nr:DUF2807 domain-containing protein [Pedobacter sp. PACM 27299]ALL04225.1 hypothetical protein AQ505_01175 [Pedobacter sp. PACM 27299]
MKTAVKSLIALTLTAIVLSTSAFTNASMAATTPTAISPERPFNKIEVRGNVKVTLVQSKNERVEVKNEVEGNEVIFKQKGYTLLINSDAKETLDIVIYVKDLQRIVASNGAKVATLGKFDLNVLQVFLNDDAKATFKGNIKSLYTVTNGSSDLRLLGTANEHILVKNKMSVLNTTDFAALKTESTFLENGIAANTKTTLVK